MEAKALKFKATYTTGQFIEKMSAGAINVIDNPKRPGTLFMADNAGKALGGVAKNIKTQADLENPVVSEVQTPEGATFYLLHNRGNGGEDRTVFSLNK